MKRSAFIHVQKHPLLNYYFAWSNTWNNLTRMVIGGWFFVFFLRFLGQDIFLAKLEASARFFQSYLFFYMAGSDQWSYMLHSNLYRSLPNTTTIISYTVKNHRNIWRKRQKIFPHFLKVRMKMRENCLSLSLHFLMIFVSVLLSSIALNIDSSCITNYK